MKFTKYISLFMFAGAAFISSADAKNIKIALVSPLEYSVGAGGQKGTQLAFMQRKAEFAKLGINLSLVSYDDGASAQKGKIIAQEILKDNEIYGVIGAFNSSVSRELGKAFADKQLAMISPASTADQLTANNWGHFNRMVAPNQAQSLAAAKYITSRLKAKSILVVSDNTVYGNGLCKSVISVLKDTKDQPVQILNYQGASNQAQYQKIIELVKRGKPSLLYYGGTAHVGAELVKAIRTADLDIPIMGGDGLETSDFAKNAGESAKNVMFTTVFGPINKFQYSDTFKLMYKREFKETPESIAVFSYDATNVLLDAIKSQYLTNKANFSHTLVSKAIRNTKMPNCAQRKCLNISGQVEFTKSGERARSRIMVMQYNKKLSLIPLYYQYISVNNLNKDTSDTTR